MSSNPSMAENEQLEIFKLQVISDSYSLLSDNLEPGSIIPYLIQERYLDHEDYETIRSRNDLCTRREKIGFLLHLILERHQAGVYDALVKGLLQERCQVSLVSRLNMALEEKLREHRNTAEPALNADNQDVDDDELPVPSREQLERTNHK